MIVGSVSMHVCRGRKTCLCNVVRRVQAVLGAEATGFVQRLTGPEHPRDVPMRSRRLTKVPLPETSQALVFWEKKMAEVRKD